MNIEASKLLATTFAVLKQYVQKIHEELSYNQEQFLSQIKSGDIGPKGDTGPKGDKGDTGPKGDKGDVGLKGDTGPQGIQGLKGDVGLKGDTGDKGDVGPQGPKGDKGDKGDVGPQGDIGPQGIQGLKGDVGAQGIRGLKGDKGDVGPKGDKGDVGPQGPKGDKGDVGLKGDKGDTGPQGPKGDKGDKGDVGPKGDRGFSGEKGEKGDQGPPGKDGNNGKDADVSKLKQDFESYKRTLNMQLSSLGGGGSSRILDMDDVLFNRPEQLSNNDILIFDSSIKKFKSLNIVDIINTIKIDLEMQYDKLIDEQVSGTTTFTYVGEASPGGQAASAVWRIKRIAEYANNLTVSVWANNTDNFDKIWNNRTTYTYDF